jgi:hypothetical protein
MFHKQKTIFKIYFKQINSVLLPFLHLGFTGNARGWSSYSGRLELTLLVDFELTVRAANLLKAYHSRDWKAVPS